MRAPGSFALVRACLQEFGYSAFDVPDTAAPQPAPTDEVLASRGIFDLLFRAETAAGVASAKPSVPKLAQAR
jgi:hypothetical protein